MTRTTNTPASPDDQAESFLQRFSRLKQEARQTGDTPLPDRSPTPLTAIDAPATVDEPAPLTDADMPDIATLDAESDYTGFLSEKVSESLRRAALRKLFHSSAFNVIDELDDYNEDFTRFQALGDLVTAEMRHRLEIERRQAEASTDQDSGQMTEREADGAVNAEARAQVEAEADPVTERHADATVPSDVVAAAEHEPSNAMTDIPFDGEQDERRSPDV